MKEYFANSIEELEELQVQFNLEDYGMSGKYPDHHWLQDDEAGVAVYYSNNIFNN